MSRPMPSQDATLRRLFLTLFLRGRTARGMRPKQAPTSIGRKLALVLSFYAVFGCFALSLIKAPVFLFSAYLHASTFVFVGLFVASASGEILFNDAEADILMHLPVEPRAMLKAKIRVLLEVSLWMAGAYNLGGTVGGLFLHGPGFVLGHLLSTLLLAVFTTSAIVWIYQLCLRFFGRERLESLMTTTQVMVGILAVLAGQLPQWLIHAQGILPRALDLKHAWLGLFPPAWFTGIDTLAAGQHSLSGILLAAVALVATALVVRSALGRLSGTYQEGLQRLQERRSPVRTGTPWHQRLVDLPILRTWIAHPVARSSFRLTLAYLVRDRDLKLRFYPAMAPLVVIPFLMLLKPGAHTQSIGFALSFLVAFLAMVPMNAHAVLQHSAHHPASEVFHAAPLEGPRHLVDGMRRAVFVAVTLPLLLATVTLVLVLPSVRPHAQLLLPGIIALPLFARMPTAQGWQPPLSCAVETSQSASRVVFALLGMLGAMVLGGLAVAAHYFHFFIPFLIAEATLSLLGWFLLRAALRRSRWTEA